MKTPYFTISKSIALEKYKIVENITDVVSYSSKTNPIVTPILEEKTNCMFSVHLVNELKNIKDKSRVIYLAQGINNDLLCNLLEEGVSWFVVDNEVDLDIILNYNTEKK